MKPYICWEPNLIDQVMNPDTLQVEHHHFLAAHHPMTMYREIATSVVNNSGVKFTELEFLREFLKPEDYIFVAVLGDSGAGKSHLIRWLSAQIPKTPNRRVLLIPKFTSLKEIIARILDGMEGEVFEKYKESLNEAVTNLSPDLARRRLADTIGQLIGPDGPHQMRNLTEHEEVFIEELHHLFYDPEYRKNVLLKDGGILHQLTDHILGVEGQSTTRRENRRLFTKDDLPVDVRNFKGASSSAMGAYRILIDSEFHEAAIEWINKNLDAAIALMLSFKGADLVNLLNDVREQLALQNTELVLLIEDFVVMQGIDHDLLDAMLVRPKQLDSQGQLSKTLCSLRVALACTSGYFEKLHDTVRTRIEFRVNVNVEAAESEEQMTNFVSLYLNAVRTVDTDLKDWYEARISGDASLAVPSKCSGCTLRESCHSGFGEVDGRGLYPFTQTSIQVMYKRLTDGKISKFNPRLLVDRIVRHTLSAYGDQIGTGSFPPPSLLEYFGGRNNKRLSGIQMRELAQKDPTNTARRETLLELWGDGDRIMDLHPAIHEAFQLPPLSDSWDDTPVQELNTPNRQDEEGKRQEGLDPNIQEKIDLLQKWANGAKLLQALAQELREAVYELLLDYIPFDDEFLLKSTLRNHLWKAGNINFVNQYTEPRRQTVNLVLPLPEHSLNDTAIAFQAIVLFKYYGAWDAKEFRDGHTYFLVLARLIGDWSRHVMRQFKHIPQRDGGSWDPVESGIEALAAAAVLSGEPVKQLNGASLINTLFRKPKSVSKYRTVEWSRLHEKISGKFEDVRKTIIQRIPATKGSSSNIKVIDAFQVVRVIEKIDPALEWKYMPPVEMIRGYEPIAEIHNLLYKEFQNTLRAEIARLASWSENVLRCIGNQDVSELVASVLSAVETARQAGVFAGAVYTDIIDALQKMKKVRLPSLMKNVNRLKSSTSLADQATILAAIDIYQVHVVDNFMRLANSFLEQSTARIDRNLSHLKEDSKAQKLNDAKEGIEQAFDRILEFLGPPKGASL
ncbi:protein DpdH [Paenibacillus tyrfis]|uniref:Uncharacterized protein n=1 Tax=Paenibacillus tyrfis TaxID=1501230 RepID=A0A081NU64_9BACL|nr:protein DpdH [Paenibacillus tyrfis]KEQ21987.1 hypothetical protein ET33_28370 [Paenibacillus tyrfis]